MPELPNSSPLEVPASRQSLRETCLRDREALSPLARAQMDEALCAAFGNRFPTPPAATIGFCWPVKGEPDLRALVREWIGAGATAALPVIDQSARRLTFHRWIPDAPLAEGPFGIPVPVGTEAVRPQCLLVPMIGFDAAGYRLGYGGGYFDRTLADWTPRPLLIGVAYELSRLTTTLPQVHDVPVDWIATEAGVFRAAAAA